MSSGVASRQDMEDLAAFTRRRNRRSLWLAAGLTVLVVAIYLGFIWYMGHGQPVTDGFTKQLKTSQTQQKTRHMGVVE